MGGTYLNMAKDEDKMNIPEGWPTEISNEVIRIIALQYGFKLKEQPSGENDLNPYVYSFARKLINMASEQIAAAPTPPVPVLQLETQLSEKDVKALNDYLVQVRATPPAQEAEPVAWLNPTANPYAPLDMHVQFQNPHDGKWIPLYTRPDDNLRKAAEGVLAILREEEETCKGWVRDQNIEIQRILQASIGALPDTKGE